MQPVSSNLIWKIRLEPIPSGITKQLICTQKHIILWYVQIDADKWTIWWWHQMEGGWRWLEIPLKKESMYLKAPPLSQRDCNSHLTSYGEWMRLERGEEKSLFPIMDSNEFIAFAFCVCWREKHVMAAIPILIVSFGVFLCPSLYIHISILST